MRGRTLRASDLDEPTLYSVYVGNLPYAVDSDELLHLISRYGEPCFCQVIRSSNGASRGFGFVSFHEASTCHDVIDRLHGQLFGGRDLILRVGDIHVMFNWFSGSRIGDRIKTLIDTEQERFRRGEKETRPPPLPRRHSPPLLPHPPPPFPPPPTREPPNSKRAIIAELFKRTFETDTEQQLKAALRRKLEERDEQERAQERDRHLFEKLRSLDAADRDLVQTMIETLSLKKGDSKPPERRETDHPVVSKARRTAFFEDDPI
jgi:RNA recognition motif-containing protein